MLFALKKKKLGSLLRILRCLFLGFFHRTRWKWRTHAVGDTHPRPNLPKEWHRSCGASLLIPHSQQWVVCADTGEFITY